MKTLLRLVVFFTFIISIVPSFLQNDLLSNDSFNLRILNGKWNLKISSNWNVFKKEKDNNIEYVILKRKGILDKSGREVMPNISIIHKVFDHEVKNLGGYAMGMSIQSMGGLMSRGLKYERPFNEFLDEINKKYKLKKMEQIVTLANIYDNYRFGAKYIIISTYAKKGKNLININLETTFDVFESFKSEFLDLIATVE